MKKHHCSAKSSSTPHPRREASPIPNKPDAIADPSINLSPERIRVGETAKTSVITEILRQHARFDHYPHGE